MLLRGEQTVGELRTRASRLEPIVDLHELQKLLEELTSRNLVVMLTPPGRGQIVSHNVYPEWELDQLQKKVAAGGVIVSDDEEDESPARMPSTQPVRPAAVETNRRIPQASESSLEIEELRAAIAQLSTRLEHIERELGVGSTKVES